jgi:hypothetical protein
MQSFLQETVTPIKMTDEYFHIEPNKGDGNCLFYSVSTAIYGTPNKHKHIRKSVHNFYSVFDMDFTYEENTLESKIQLQLLLENDEEEENKHQNIIKHDKVWGKLVDLFVIALLFDINVIIFNVFDKYNYTILPIHACNFETTRKSANIHIRYDSIQEHYEAMFPINMEIEHVLFSPTQKFINEELEKMRKTWNKPKITYAEVLANTVIPEIKKVVSKRRSTK